MDPLSDVLSLLKPRSYVSGGFDLGADLAIQFPKHQGIPSSRQSCRHAAGVSAAHRAYPERVG